MAFSLALLEYLKPQSFVYLCLFNPMNIYADYYIFDSPLCFLLSKTKQFDSVYCNEVSAIHSAPTEVG